jgi:predicted Holliday junction resolvase-like endonuclease
VQSIKQHERTMSASATYVELLLLLVIHSLRVKSNSGKKKNKTKRNKTNTKLKTRNRTDVVDRRATAVASNCSASLQNEHIEHEIDDVSDYLIGQSRNNKPMFFSDDD